MNWRLDLGQPLETRTSMPVDKALRVGDEIIPIVGDDTRKLLQGYLTHVGDQPLSKPVLQEGGFDFALGQPVDPVTGLRDVWGNAAGAATSIGQSGTCCVGAWQSAGDHEYHNEQDRW
jgi:hypothetical protein